MATNKGQVEDLIEIGMALDLFRSPEGRPYAAYVSGGRKVNAPVRSPEFTGYLRAEYRCAHKRGANSNALKEAVAELAYHAIEHGEVHPVFFRTAVYEDACYLDLADDEGTVIRIDRDGWRAEPDPPVRFERAASMHPLPMPKPGGDLKDLWRFLNIPERDRVLVIACLVALLRYPGPYPVLILEGGQGSGKSTAVRVLRRLVDPSGNLVRRKPRDERDVRASLEHDYVLAYDNLERIPNWLSDVLCTVATGGTFGGRVMGGDTEETARYFQRPAILNGIVDVTGREDLRSRAVIVKLERLKRRRVERLFWQDFEKMHPRLLGVLLDALSAALRVFPNLDPDALDLPRMADFSLLGIALEQALGWDAGTFLRSYARNEMDAMDEATSVDTVVQMVQWAMGSLKRQGDRPQMMQTATELWDWFDSHGPKYLQRDHDWPKSARSFAARLRRAVPVLTSYGIEVEFDCRAPDASRRRLIRITIADQLDRAA